MVIPHAPQGRGVTGNCIPVCGECRQFIVAGPLQFFDLASPASPRRFYRALPSP